MTKEEAISVFKDKLNWANQNRYPYVSQREAEAYRIAIKALEQTRWISVNERLPEEGLAVLTYRENGDYEVNWLDFDGKWFWEDVVAWMPLPPCYDPQESEEVNE